MSGREPPDVGTNEETIDVAQGAGNKGKKAPVGRQSVAAVRKSSATSNRSQLIIGAVAILAIIGVVVTAVVLNRQNTAKPVEGYGSSTQSVATWNDSMVTVDNGTEPAVTIDLFQDPLCPVCQMFEEQYGEQINQAVDQGKLRVNYHTLTFLDPKSASGDYSTRAAAALQCVAVDADTPKGAWMQFVERLYADGTMPAEGGSADLTNEALASIPGELGASAAAQDCISSGARVAEAAAANQAGQDILLAAVGQVGTPTVLKDGQPLATNDTTWLTQLIG